METFLNGIIYMFLYSNLLIAWCVLLHEYALFFSLFYSLDKNPFLTWFEVISTNTNDMSARCSIQLPEQRPIIQCYNLVGVEILACNTSVVDSRI